MTLRSMAATQATTATTLNHSPDRKQAAGRDTKWKWKLGEPTPTPLRKQNDDSPVASYLRPNKAFQFLLKFLSFIRPISLAMTCRSLVLSRALKTYSGPSPN